MIAIGLAIDDVDGTRQDDEERRIALSLLEQDLPRGERQLLAVFRQLLDLSRREPREQVGWSGSRKPGTGVGEVYWLTIERVGVGYGVPGVPASPIWRRRRQSSARWR